MRYLIISDLHSNLRALDAVLADAAGEYDAAVCCGDVVGYCAEPNEVVDWVRLNTRAVVRGNHDKACAGIEDMDWFNSIARAAIGWTQNELSPENLEYLQNLDKGPVQVDGFTLFHGSPVDEDEYLTTAFEAGMMVPYLDAQLSFFGHTHLQGGFVTRRQGTRKIDQPAAARKEAAIQLEETAWYLVNPGSVGQPRDHDPRAAYALVSPEERLVRLRRVGYDVSGAQAAIRRAGLPESLAMRLALGQ
ncbi:MAG: metallophosphoesterase family protein [Acidobacteria bacterium]|nr:metallophosphoesterase family protein [Acidobacteriota bacterium]